MSTIWAKVTTQFFAIHYWPEAVQDVDYLKHPHRHVFHVTVWIEQHHQHRDVEYIQLKERLEQHFRDFYEGTESTRSCETFAQEIAQTLQMWFLNRKVRVEVTEDGENGALVEL